MADKPRPGSLPPGAAQLVLIEAQQLLQRNGFVFTLDLSAPVNSLSNAGRWEKMAFTLYTLIAELADKERS
jgi:hypothetical protein